MPLDDLVQVIETLQQRIRDHGDSLRQNEIRTRVALIDPLLTALGWDVSDPGLVTAEYGVAGGRADHAFWEAGHTPAATLEAKKLGEVLEPHRLQMLNYSNAAGIRFAGLTDGNVWELYEIFKQGSLEERRILNVTIASEAAFQCALKLLLMWRANLATGRVIPAATPILDGSSTGGGNEGPPPPGNWQPLAELQSVTGTTAPTTIKFPNGEEREIVRWWRILAEVAEWLATDQKLTSAQVPIRIGNRQLYIVHSEEIHSNGNSFYRSHKLSNGLFCEVGISANDAVANARYLLQRFDQDPASVMLKFD